MRFFSADLTLYEMERQLEHCFLEDEDNIRTIGDINLTYEEYKYMTLKMKGIVKYISKVEVMEQYKLCILTTLVFAIRYDKNVTVTLKHYEGLMNQFQQHQYRFCMHIFADAFHEMGLPDYGIQIDSTGELVEVLSMHAGLTKNIYEEIFEILDQHFAKRQSYVFEEELYSRIDRIVFRMYPFLNYNSNNLRLSCILKELCEACYIGHEALEQLYESFDMLSKQLIENCYRWYKAYGNNSNNLIKMR